MSPRTALHYELCGLRVGSGIELPLRPAAPGGVDVEFRWGADVERADAVPTGTVIASAATDDEWWYVAVDTGEGYLVRVRDCADFVISADLGSVEVRRAATGDRAHLVPVLLAGTVVSFVLMLRGATLMHASAVAIDGRAVAFVGQSGRGKSTVAALMCAADAALVTDDVLVVRGGTRPTCVGGAAELRLRPNAAPIAYEHDASRARTTVDERVGFGPREVIDEVLPLGAIVIPTPDREISEIRVERLPQHAALFALLSFPRVYGWRREDELTRDFAVYREIVAAVPTFAAWIPWGPPFDPGVADALGRLLDERTEPEEV